MIYFRYVRLSNIHLKFSKRCYWFELSKAAFWSESLYLLNKINYYISWT